ncbi:HAMP domain-containing histidine kinase [Sporolactobacillus sp. THM7-7]|nr:HAMP domain-containing histidine kinase [Sporolactobacillus sp. THM7-7]
MRLRTRIQLLSTALLLVMLLLTNCAVYFLFYKMTMNSEMNRLERQAKNMMSALHSESAGQVEPENLLRAYLPEDGMIRIIGEKENEKLTVAAHVSYRDIKTSFRQRQDTRLVDLNGMLFAAVTVPMIWRDGSIVNFEVIHDIRPVYQNLNLLKIILAAATLLTLLPTFFASKMLSRLILDPIRTMMNTMEEIQKSHKIQKIALENHSKDELHKMAGTFNRMMDILQQNFEKQQQFVSDASHELKTPLTVIESYAEMLKRWGKEKEDVLDESIEAIHSEAVRMKALTRQMLLLARSEEEWGLNLKETDMVFLCRETAGQFEKVYGRNIEVIAECPRLFNEIDPQKIRQLLVILLDNAIKYSEKAVTVRNGVRDGRAFIEVEDRGIGIPEKDVEKVFDRFFRVDKVRSRETGGSGLGLAIARRIVAVHKGEIGLQSREGSGTTVTVFLPIIQAVVRE